MFPDDPDIQRSQYILGLTRLTPDKLIRYALAAGFYDQAHFSRLFARMVGVTPKRCLQSRDGFVHTET